MAEQPNPAVEFLETCIDQLETQASRIGKAVGTLRALQVTARDVDHEHIQAMARAVLEQVYNADSRFVHGPRHYLGPPPATQMTQTEAAAEVLRGAGRPLSTGDIVNWMIRLGFYPADNIRDLKQFNNSVFSAMSRKAEKGEVFRKVAPGTWGLLEWETERKEGAEE